MENAIETCLIVIDSGFSQESLCDAKVLAVRDLVNHATVIGAPFVAPADLRAFASDPFNHGSVVLTNLRNALPDAPVILIRAIGSDGKIVRTTWRDGNVVQEGWTEAYLWAVELCARLGMTSVANCSFGGVVHAADGTGWEAHQLARVTGAGKPGHVLVAASGSGDGRAVHAAWQTEPGESKWIVARQTESTTYNFWAGAAHQAWWLTVRRNGEVVHVYEGAFLDSNMWNARQQLTIDVEGAGEVTFEFALPAAAKEKLRCDCWVRGEESARFHNYVDAHLVVEPAVFQHVIATGLRSGNYAPNQNQAGAKPDVLVDGNGPISFRTPEVTAAIARLLQARHGLDVDDVRGLLSTSYPK